MKIVRKRLSADEIQPAGTRYDPDTDTVQVTPDGGTTWNDAPGLDIRHADSFRLPPLSGSSAQCDAAARMAAYVNDQINNFLNAGSLAQAATAVLGVLLILTGGAGIIIDAILLGMDALITLGATNISSAFTTTVYEQLKCTFYCHIDANGQMSAAQLAAFQNDVFLNYSSTVYSTMITIGSFTGEVQYSNAGVERSETGDCTSCACDHCFKLDFAVGNGSGFGWVNNGASYIAACCWQGNNFGGGDLSDLSGYWVFPSTIHVLQIDMEYYKGGGAGGDNVNHLNTLVNPVSNYATTLVTQYADNTTDPDNRLHKIVNPLVDLDGIGVDINSGSFTTTVQLYSITVTYSGDEVFGGDNC